MRFVEVDPEHSAFWSWLHVFAIRDLFLEDGSVVDRTFEADAWCEEHFGPDDDERWTRMNLALCFSRPEDAFAFKMKWG